MNIAVLVSGGGTNLAALIKARDEGRLGGGRLCAVISSKPDVFALERARDAGIPAFVVSRRGYETIHDFSRAVENALALMDIGLVVHAGFLSIMDSEFCRAFPHQINVHPALIPSFCGKGMYGIKVHEAALARGVKISGATVHFVNEEADGGPIIFQKAVDILDGDTPESLQARIMQQCEHVLLPKAVRLFCQGALRLENGKAVIFNERVDI